MTREQRPTRFLLQVSFPRTRAFMICCVIII